MDNRSLSNSSNIIAFQGVLGAYSHMACQAVKPEMGVLPCRSFEDMILAVQDGNAALFAALLAANLLPVAPAQ